MRNWEGYRNAVIVRRILSNDGYVYYFTRVSHDGWEGLASKEYRTELGILRAISRKYSGKEVIKEY